jgi:hypothetical protein
LAGDTEGALLSVSGKLVAAVGTERGVWAAQSSRGGRFGRTRRLSSAGARPESLSAGGISGGAVIAWTQRDQGNSVPRAIWLSSGTAHRGPSGRRVVEGAPSSHRIDEVAVVGGTGSLGKHVRGVGPTLAWVESWYDTRGAYHSQTEEADVANATAVGAFPVAGQIASGLSLVADGRGDQVLAWKTCTRGGVCSVWASVRRRGGGFSGERRLGSIQASESPSAALSGKGQGLVGWIEHGHVLAAELRASARRFSAAHTVSNTHFAYDLTLQFGPSGSALAAWSQGTLAPEVVGATFR